MPEGSTRIERRDEIPSLPFLDGITIKPVIGAGMHLQQVILEPGSVAPIHTHDEEQIGYIVSGTCEFTDGESHWELGPGDCYHAPPGAPHGARGMSEGCVLIDVFSPPRAAVIQMLKEHDAE